MKYRYQILLLALFLLAISGCSSIQFLYQAGLGQLSLQNRARSIATVIQDPKTPSRIVRLLQEVDPIKQYGEAQGLKPTRNYVEYVSLDRPVAVWVVSASESLKFKSKEWSFPIVGQMPYLGWFDLESGKRFAEELKKEGWDVDLRGAGAYSTLGWFKDPVLSSMIPPGDEALGELVNVILHESVHATYYLSGQAYFNESLASFVGDRLTNQYLQERYGSTSTQLLSYQKIESEQAQRQLRMFQSYHELERLYESSVSEELKRQKKQEIISQLMQDLKAKRELNNASLIQYKTYHTGREEFQQIFEGCQKRWKCFWGKIFTIKEDQFQESQDPHLTPVLKRLL